MPLTAAQKAGWGLADLGIGVFVVVKQLLIFAYLTAYLGVPPAAAGWVTTAVLAFDVVTDPLVGLLSDRTRSRWGRRAPWIGVGAPLLALGIVLMFRAPETLPWQGAMAWVVGFFGLATVGFTFVAVPYGAMAGEMTDDPNERSTMTAWRMVFASLGLLLAGALVPALAGDSRDGYARAVLAVAPLVVAAIWGMLWLTRAAPRIDRPAPRGAEVLRLVAANRPFAILVALYALMTSGVAILAAGLQLAALYLIADDGGPLSGAVAALGLFSTLFAGFVLGAVVSQWGWVLASRALGKLGAIVFGLVLYICVLLAVHAVLPGGALTLVAGLFVLAGVANGAYQQIPWAMYPDLMDVTRRQSGAPIEGAFSAIWLFGQKIANAIAPAVVGGILAAAGWRESRSGAVEQTPGALAALQATLTLVPAMIFALAILGLVTIYRAALRRAGEAIHD